MKQYRARARPAVGVQILDMGIISFAATSVV